MNFFWGGGPMSWMRYMTLESFCRHNPDWDVTLWLGTFGEVRKHWSTHERQDFVGYTGDDYLPKVDMLSVRRRYVKPHQFVPHDITPVHESDLFRWWLLSEEGGWYADLDILWIKPMEPVRFHTETAICQANKSLAIGLLGGAKGNPFYREVFKLACERVDPLDYQSAGTKCVHEVLYGKRGIVLASITAETICIRYDGGLADLPQNYVYPWHWKKISEFFNAVAKVPTDTVGIHWYAGTDIAQAFNNKLTEKTLNIPTTFNEYIK